MATSLQDFLKTTTTNNFRITNLFEITVTPPTTVQAVTDGWELIKDGKIVFFADGFTIPSRTQNFADVGFKGYAVPVPTNIEMEKEHTITVRADSNGYLRNFFLQWLNYVTNSEKAGSFAIGEKSYDETSTIKVSLLDPETGRETSETYTMYGVRIMSVGGFTVSNTDANVATFDVGFKSVYWDHTINKVS